MLMVIFWWGVSGSYKISGGSVVKSGEKKSKVGWKFNSGLSSGK
uniref:ATP synthase F0 subunit 8 n=1 Tax=Pronodularia japanensis TaxID=1835347 RepID=A0A6F8PI56_9BIVA|nr:ATP synthase F0 subunit 8 [Pronodularia japanensis]